MSTPVSVPVARSPEQRDPAVEEAIAGEAPQRAGKALLGYVPEQNVRNLFYAAAVTSPPSMDELVALSRIYRLVRPQPSSVVAPLPQPRPFPQNWRTMPPRSGALSSSALTTNRSVPSSTWFPWMS
jgi:hypothetical protein